MVVVLLKKFLLLVINITALFNQENIISVAGRACTEIV